MTPERRRGPAYAIGQAIAATLAVAVLVGLVALILALLHGIAGMLR